MPLVSAEYVGMGWWCWELSREEAQTLIGNWRPLPKWGDKPIDIMYYGYKYQLTCMPTKPDFNTKTGWNIGYYIKPYDRTGPKSHTHRQTANY